MDAAEITAKMSGLLKMNQGSVQVYDEAIGKIQDQQVKTQLQHFRDEHQHHVQEIQSWFTQSGQQQGMVSKEFQQLLQVTLAATRQAQSHDQVMQCMHIAEAFDNAEYGEAMLVRQAPQEFKQLVQSHLQMEHQHLHFVEQYSPLMQAVGTTGGASSMSGGAYGGGGTGGMGY